MSQYGAVVLLGSRSFGRGWATRAHFSLSRSDAVAGRVDTAPAHDRQPDLWCFSGSGPEPLHRIPELWLF
jgi:hypothetical protein